MNKVINININGIVFHVDEEAYEILNRYLESLKRHFKNTEGGEEILSDIESRIAEMLTERLKNRGEVVSMADVQQVIATMGTPEDMQDEEPETKSRSRRERSRDYYYTAGKRVYRDPDNKIIAGVCSGISEYFDIDPLWLRLLFVAVFFGFGTGLLIYIILWIILPPARTASERLEMRGERINISNIEKTVKENIDSIKDRIDQEFKNFDRKDFNSRVHHFFDGLGEGISQGMGPVFYVFARIFSIIIAFISVMALIVIVCAILGAVGVISVSIPGFTYDIFDNHQQATAIFILLAIVLGLPFVALLSRAIRYLAGYKRRSRALSGLFGSIWFLAFIALLIMGFTSASNFGRSFTYNTVDELKKPAHDTIYLAVNQNRMRRFKGRDNGGADFFDLWHHINFHKETIALGFVTLDISRADDKKISLEKNYYSRGKDEKEADVFAESIQYSYFQRDSLITFDDGFQLAQGAKWRAQTVNLDLKIPEGTVVVLKKGMQEIIYDIENTSDTYDGNMIGYRWLMTANGLMCLDCPKDEPNRRRHRNNRRHYSWRYGRHHNDDDMDS